MGHVLLVLALALAAVVFLAAFGIIGAIAYTTLIVLLVLAVACLVAVGLAG